MRLFAGYEDKIKGKWKERLKVILKVDIVKRLTISYSQIFVMWKCGIVHMAKCGNEIKNLIINFISSFITLPTIPPFHIMKMAVRS